MIDTKPPSAEMLKFVHETMETMEEGLTIRDKFRWASAIEAFAEQRAAEALEMIEQHLPYCGSNVQDALRRVLDMTRRALADQVKP